MNTKPTRTSAREAAEDIFFGQVALLWARWFFIAAGAVIALWSATTAAQLLSTILVVVVLMGLNFFLHGRYLMEKPANQWLLMLVSWLDMAIIGGIVMLWPGAQGLKNEFYILFYPLVFAFALVFQPRFAVPYTLATLALYTTACLVHEALGIFTLGNLEVFFMRVITLAAMGGLGTFYYRTIRAKRPATANYATKA